jgi:hypothetical protein
MRENAELHCRCGEVRGRVAGPSPNRVNRAVCYCDDCQAFLHHLGCADLLNEHGGTDIVQVAPASLSFGQGQERIVGVRLTPKGLYRWYASCCRTPVGNTVGPAVPFVGIVVAAFASETQRPDEIFGPPVGAIYGKYAVRPVSGVSSGLDPRLVVRALRMVFGWRVGGKTWPHPFFDQATRAPKFPFTTLLPTEREALRLLCGPGASRH